MGRRRSTLERLGKRRGRVRRREGPRCRILGRTATLTWDRSGFWSGIPALPAPASVARKPTRPNRQSSAGDLGDQGETCKRLKEQAFLNLTPNDHFQEGHDNRSQCIRATCPLRPLRLGVSVGWPRLVRACLLPRLLPDTLAARASTDEPESLSSQSLDPMSSGGDSSLEQPADLAGKRVTPSINPLEFMNPPPLPPGTVVRVFEQEPGSCVGLCLLVRLDREARIQLPSRNKTVSFRYVLTQSGTDWNTARKGLLGEVPDWLVKWILYGSSYAETENHSRVNLAFYTTIAPGLVHLETRRTLASGGKGIEISDGGRDLAQPAHTESPRGQETGLRLPALPRYRDYPPRARRRLLGAVVSVLIAWVGVLLLVLDPPWVPAILIAFFAIVTGLATGVALLVGALRGRPTVPPRRPGAD